MPRPNYETWAQHQAEDEVAKKLERAWCCEISPHLGDHGLLDRLAFRNGDPKLWIEIKCRDNTSDKHPDYLISMRKIHTARRWRDLTTLETLVVVQFTDRLIWFNPLRAAFEERVGGRYDRNDPADVELCAFFKPDVFKLVVRSNQV
jgi:hypothetical protein